MYNFMPLKYTIIDAVTYHGDPTIFMTYCVLIQVPAVMQIFRYLLKQA